MATPEQLEARKNSAKSGHIKWIKDHCMRKCNDELKDDYVFISYKSDEYEEVLDGIVYETCRKYGLRVYFDTAFDEDDNSWVKQFYNNMCSPRCKAIIAFVSNKYYTSYATLMEIMASRTQKAGKRQRELFYLPINLEAPEECKEDDDKNTGLGTERFEDNKLNKSAGLELKLFNKFFKQMHRRWEELDELYDRFDEKNGRLYKEAVKNEKGEIIEVAVGEPYLKSWECYSIMNIVIPEDKNDNDGSNKDFVEVIRDKLITAGFRSVFEKGGEIIDWGDEPTQPEPTKPELTKPELTKPELTQPEPPKPMPKPPIIINGPKPLDSGKKTGDKKDSRPADPISGRISITDFINDWSGGTDPKGKSKFGRISYKSVRLVGEGEYAKYTTDNFDSCRHLADHYINKRIDEMGMEYINKINNYIKSDNPPFLPAGETNGKKVTYSPVKSSKANDYRMNMSFSDYDFVYKVLSEHIKAIGLPIDKFCLEFESNIDNSTAAKEEDPTSLEETVQTPATVTTPVNDDNDENIGGKDDTRSKKEGSRSADPISGRIAITDFINNWRGTDTKGKGKFGSRSYKSVRLVGEGEYAKYTTGNFDSCRHLADHYINKRIDEMGMEYINKVNSYIKSDNPPFLTAAEANNKKIASKAKTGKDGVRYSPVTSSAVNDYRMNTNFSDYDFVSKVLSEHFKALGLPADKFYLEFEGNE